MPTIRRTVGKEGSRKLRRRTVAALVLAGIFGACVWGYGRFTGETRLRRMSLDGLRREALTHPNDPGVFLILSQRLRQGGELRPAAVMAGRAYDLSDGAPRFTAAKAGALIDAGDFDAALRVLKEALSHNPDSGELKAQLSRVYASRGYFSDALREAEAAVRLDSRLVPAWQALGNACSLNKRPDQAFAAFERAMRQEPRHAVLLADYGEALQKYGRADQAEAMLRRSMTLAPRWARPVRLLGQLKAERAGTAAERASARTLLERALALAPMVNEVRYQLALLEMRDGRAQRAIPLLKASLAVDPGLGEAFLALGQACQSAGQTAAAQEAFAAWRAFSNARREVGHLEARLRRAPEDVALLRRLAGLHAAQGRTELAAEYRRRIQDLQSGSRAAGPKPTSERGTVSP